MEPFPREAEALLAHRGFVTALARQLVRDEHKAEDLAQQTWLVALQEAPREGGSLRSWLATVVRRLASRFARREQGRLLRERSVARSSSVAATSKVVETLQVQRQLVQAVLRLPEPYRSTLFHRYMEDLPPRQIAQRSGVELETVKARLKRGLQRLREQLDTAHEGRREAWLPALVWLQRRDFAPESTMAELQPALWGNRRRQLQLLAGAVLGAIACYLVSRERPQPAGLPVAAAPVEDRQASVAHREATERQLSTRLAARPKAPISAGVDLQLALRWQESGTPAAGIAARIVSWRVPQPFLHTQYVRADPQGILRLANLPAGATSLSLDRGGSQLLLDLGSDHRNGSTLWIPVGVHVAGTVLDPDGRAVDSAWIWLSEPYDFTEGCFLLQTDSDGRFSLRSVSPRCWIGARKRGFAPTALTQVGTTAGEALALTLQFEHQGGAVSGSVLTADGRAINDAVVRVGPAEPEAPNWQESRPTAPAPAFVLPVDLRGEFLAEGLSAGRVAVAARSPVHSPVVQWVEIHPGETVPAKLILRVGSELRGTVRNPRGQPVPEARVGVGRGDPFLSFASSLDNFLASLCQTDAHGTFALQGLPDGPQQAWVRGAGRPLVETDLELHRGLQQHWEVELPESAYFRGRLLAPDGQPLADWRIQSTWTDPARCAVEVPRTDGQGRFLLGPCPDAPLDLVVREPVGLWPCAWFSKLPPTTASTELSLQELEMPSAHLQGRLLDDRQQGISGAEVSALRRFDTLCLPQTSAADGTFRIGPLPAGEYGLMAQAPTLPKTSLVRCVVAAHENLQLGDFVLGSPAHLTVRLTLAAGRTPLHPLEVQVFDPQLDAVIASLSCQANAELFPLAAGPRWLQVVGPGVHPHVQALSLVPGSRHEEVVELRPATTRLLRLKKPRGCGARVLSLEMSHQSEVIVRQTLQSALREWKLVLGLDEGSYRVRAHTEIGMQLQATFSLSALASDLSVPLTHQP